MIYAAMLTIGQFALGATAAPAQAPASQHRNATKRRGWMRLDANTQHTWMYVSGINDSTVGIYDLDKFGAPQIGQITDGLSGPAGITLDAQSNLYVVNYLGYTVTIYPPRATTPSLTRSKDLVSPVGVAVTRAMMSTLRAAVAPRASSSILQDKPLRRE